MSSRMVIAVASDHAGVSLKAELLAELKRLNLEHVDLGPQSTESVDYPDFASKVAERVAKGEATLGVLVCGTGIGMSITANKVHGIRAAVCRTEFEAKLSRRHNDANVLCLGARVTGSGLALEILGAFLAAQFEGGRHLGRVEKIKQLEARR